jgi:hypothetical protein
VRIYPNASNLIHPVPRFERDDELMTGEALWSMERCVANYKGKLIIIIAELFKLARIVPGEVPDVNSGGIWDISLPRYCWQKVLALLTPAESALRRLIIMAADGKTYVPETLELKPGKAKSKDAAGNAAAVSGLADAPANCGEGQTVSGEMAQAPSAAATPSSFRPPAFDMFDPLKKFGYCGFYDDDEWEALQAQKAAAGPLVIPEADPRKRMDPVNALSLWKRIQALHHAAENFGSYVTRYINWYARQRYQLKHNLKITGRKRLCLMRGGSIPGYVHKGKHEVHDLLLDVHNLAWDSLSPPKYRWKPG